MARDVDIVIQALGINEFKRPFGVSGTNLTQYNRALQARNLKRTLLNLNCGSQNANGDFDPNIKELMAEIDKATGNDVKRIGAVALYGDSNGSGQTLALAMALQKRGAPKPVYLGLGDLTMMPFGRDPTIRDIGNLQPINMPNVSLGTAIFLGATSRLGLPPQVADNDFPRIRDPGVVGDLMENYYTRGGNRMRIYTQSPAGADNWWWTSTQNFGEVHGEIEGGNWKNIVKATTSEGSILTRGPGSIDEGHHVDLCGQAMREMQFKAGEALANFVRTLTP
jgi:hypothetical protein